MTERIRIQNLLRLTLTRKGRAIAKHPLLRTGVVEAIKASQAEIPDEPLWETPEEEGNEDWYGDFADFIASVPAEDIPESWEEAFASEEYREEYAVKAGTKKKKNYPESRGPFAGPHNSFPIKTQQDVYDAARLVGHASNPAAVKERIIRIAHSRGFQLPKSWRRGQTHATKSQNSGEPMFDEAQFEELVTRLQERLSSVAPAADPAAAEPETPPTEAVKAEEVEAEKAKMSHSHEHNHSTQRGYGYSHTHDHTHGSMEDHETSEAAHGHDHVSKAGEADEELPEAVKADLAGLDADLKARTEALTAAQAELEALKAEHETLKAELAEKTKVAETVEAVKAELAAAVEEARKPLIAGIPTTEKAQPDIKSLPFDDALQALLHS